MMTATSVLFQIMTVVAGLKRLKVKRGGAASEFCHLHLGTFAPWAFDEAGAGSAVH